MTHKQLAGSMVALISALVLVASAAAGGEPKNNTPFTRAIGGSMHAATRADNATESIGEPKNEVPFTLVLKRPGAGPDAFERYAAAHPYGAGLGATNALQPGAVVPDAFERYAAAHPYGAGLGTTTFAASATVAVSKFRWSDVALGAAAMAATILLLGASLLFVRARRQAHIPHPAGS